MICQAPPTNEMEDSQNNSTRKRLTPAEILERHRYKGKLTPLFREKALAMVKAGSPPRTALRALGCSDRLIYQWESDAKQDVITSKGGLFRSELQACEQEWLSSLSAKAYDHAGRDGRVCVDMLARRDAEHWARTDTLQVNQTIEAGPILAQIAAAQRQIAEGSYINGDWSLEEGKDAIQEPREAEGSSEKGGS